MRKEEVKLSLQMAWSYIEKSLKKPAKYVGTNQSIR